ncbi:MAG: hypothetical protein JSU69_07940, partial [Candidatus Zixiibacteriota bacterium]
MKRSVILLTALISIALFTQAGAIDYSRVVFHDIPDDLIEKQLGKMPPSRLTRLDSLNLASYRFTGDTLKVMVILVKWYDRQPMYPGAMFDSAFLSRDVYPGGSIADYYDEVSYGQVTVVGDVIDWRYYGFYTGWVDFESILNELDGTVDFSQYDGDQDGNVDAAVFVRAGNGQEDSGDPNDIWSYAITFAPGDGLGPYDGVLVPALCTVPETMPLRDPDNPTVFLPGQKTFNRISVAAHELAHDMGLPDLYDYDNKLDVATYTTPNDNNDHPFVDWCLMGYGGYGIMALGKIVPTHLSGWCKKEIGWITPIALEETEYQDLVINNIETTNDSSLYKIPIDPAEEEYFLLEYRNPRSTGRFDKIDSDFSVYLWP